MYMLIVNTGKHKGKKIVLPEREVFIGRDENAFVRMTSAEVSRKHCLLHPTEKGLLVRDLGSQNGTVVNGVRIESETLMRPGDHLQIGPIQFVVSGGRPSKAAPGIDDDIFGWLSESDTATDIPNASDTTVVKAAALAAGGAAQPPAKAPPPADAKPKFRTIGEEAQDIIRRHKESLEKT